MRRLEGKVTFITGAASDIGQCAAVLFTQEGARVVVADINDVLAKETLIDIKQVGGEAIYVNADITNPNSVENVLQKAADHFGKIDVIYNNAGGSVPEDGPVTDVSIDDWLKISAFNLFGTFLCCKFGIPFLIKSGGGSVILTGSLAGMRRWNRSAYTAAKGGSSL